MTKSKAKELSYYFFFGLMVFAKGIGLDSGNRMYYLLSVAACLCVGCKLVLTKYSNRRAVAMALLCAIAFVAYRNSGRLGIVLTVLAIIGLKDMDIRKLFRLGMVIYSCAFAFTVVMAKIGIKTNPLDVHWKGGTEVIRWGMGYSTGNIFHVSYFILTVFLCYTWGKRYNIRRLLVLMAGNLIVFFYSFSYTGIIVTTFYLLLNLYAVKRKRLGRVERVLCQLPLPLCLLFSFVTPFLLHHPLVQKLDTMMQARLTFSSYYLQNQPITLFGTRMKDVPNFWVIMDNGYVYIFMTFGIVAFVLFVAGYGVIIARYGKQERLSELAVIFSFLLYGIMEQFISNAFMNLSLLFLGEALFGGGREKAEEENREKRSVPVWQWACCAGAGCIITAIYLMAVPAAEYIKVPLDSLPYVDAWSAEVRVDNKENTKEELKEKMAGGRSLMEQPAVMEEAIRKAGLEQKLSAEEAAAAMEYSIPISVQSSRDYDRYRVRLLGLYCNITEEEYSRLLVQLMELVEQSDAWKADAITFYQERIQKSAGEDRIEHMSGEKIYMVEKNGSIPELEHFRDGVFAGTAGTALLAVLLNVLKLLNSKFLK